VRPPRLAIAAAALTLVRLAFVAPAAAHDIPADVTVQAYLKPEGPRLHLVVRVPLGAMRDVEFPTRGPGYLDLARAEGALRHAANRWIVDQVELYEDDARLPAPRIAAARVSLPSDRSFASFEEARAHFTDAPLPEETELYWSQGLLDVWLDYRIRSPGSRFSIRPGLGRLGLSVVTVIRFLPPGGAVRAFELPGDPGLVRLDPRWHQAALRFVELGFFHILDGTDHLLFLLCLVIPFRRRSALIVVVTSFTVAHSITLIASAFGFGPDALWFPPLIETLIALSIVYMALENIVAPQMRRRWLITLGFGLVHGFGFSFALSQTLQFAGSHLLTSLLAFNVGVELGQLLVLVLLVPLLDLLFRFAVAERIGTILLSALLAHTGWHWLIERFDRLRQFRFEWPAMSAALLAAATRWLMLAVIAGGLAWLVFGVLLPAARRRAEEEAVAKADE
jgi:hypothetical protein